MITQGRCRKVESTQVRKVEGADLYLCWSAQKGNDAQVDSVSSEMPILRNGKRQSLLFWECGAPNTKNRFSSNTCAKRETQSSQMSHSPSHNSVHTQRNILQYFHFRGFCELSRCTKWLDCLEDAATLSLADLALFFTVDKSVQCGRAEPHRQRKLYLVAPRRLYILLCTSIALWKTLESDPATIHLI